MICEIKTYIEEAIVEGPTGSKTFINVVIERKLTTGRVHRLQMDPREVDTLVGGLLALKDSALRMQGEEMKKAVARKMARPLTATIGQSLGIQPAAPTAQPEK